MNSPAPSRSALSELRAHFGERFSTVPDVLEQHGRDESHTERHLPDAVIFAHTEDEVRRVLKVVGRCSVPITPFAAGSSLEGQLIPLRGGISLDASQMNKVLDIQPQGFLATAQSGVTYPALNRQARHQAYYAARALHPGHAMLSTDLCVPLHKLAPTIALTHRLCAENKLDASVVGHVGDGNFHVLFHTLPEDAATWQSIRRVYDLMVEQALAVGSTCSGEHGIGLHKRRHLRAQHGDLLELMRGIKALFDPQGLMNPGKILEGEA